MVFLGTVGAGKSTHARLIALRHRANVARVRVTGLKTDNLAAHLLTIVLMKMLVKSKKEAPPLRSLIEENCPLFRKLFSLWLALDIFCVYVKFLFSIYIPTKLGYFVIVEDYIPSAIADYIYLCKLLRLPTKKASFAIDLARRLIPTGGSTKAVFLNADTGVLESRWKRRGTLEEKHDYLHMQRTLLLLLTRRLIFDLLYIDTTHRTVKEVHEIVTNFLESRMPCIARTVQTKECAE